MRKGVAGRGERGRGGGEGDDIVMMVFVEGGYNGIVICFGWIIVSSSPLKQGEVCWTRDLGG